MCIGNKQLRQALVHIQISKAILKDDDFDSQSVFKSSLVKQLF